jgi:GT2 family glycosyltransferase
MISLLLVNYRSAALAEEAIRTARASCAQPLQVVVVDNSCDPLEAEALRPHADRLLVSSSNRGYAGAINDGRRVCEGETIIISNPDVTFAAGAIDRLQMALRDAAIAGPALFWDEAHEWRLPPGDLLNGREKLDEVLASRSRAWREQRDLRRFRKRVKFWSLEQTTRVAMLSGAVMAIRTDVFDALEGFDERFPLYFEETDFLRRAGALRRRIVYVPAARVHHIFNQSAAQTAAESAARYAQSEMRYLEKWIGPLAARVLKNVERALPPREATPVEGAIELDRDDVVVEASPLASFATAAGHFPKSRSVSIPADVRGSMTGDLFVRVVVRTTGQVVGTYRIKP